jgi:L-arabinose isomerase
MNTKDTDAVYEQAKIELAMRRFLEKGSYKAFTTTFEDLHGLKQLHGLRCRGLPRTVRFGGEGDWKTSALSSVKKYMAQDFRAGQVLWRTTLITSSGQGGNSRSSHA